MEKNIPLLLKARANQYPEITAQAYKDKDGVFQYVPYSKMYEQVILFAVGLESIGIKRGDNVAFISDNRREWFISDLAILSLGAIDVPRGCDSMSTEIRFIISFSDCQFGIFENCKQLEKVFEKYEECSMLKTVILFDDDNEETIAKAKKLGMTVYSFDDVMKKGEEKGLTEQARIESEMEKTEETDVATIIFTSGTTGVPKGVMLTHQNYIAQCAVVKEVLPIKPGDMWLSVLPVWHSFERAIQYINLEFASGLAYSKPIGAIMLPDFAVIKPTWMCGVPRLWDSLAQGIFRAMKQQGGIKLAMFNFFVAIGKKYSWAHERVTGRVCRFSNTSNVPNFLIGIIPLILLTPLYALGNVLVFKKIRAKMGGRMVAAISGGGALQPAVDSFYRAIGLKLLEGYGITEAGPVLSVRALKKARPGCVGVIFPSAEIKIVAEEQGKIISDEPLPPGSKGLILARGTRGLNQIMKGYYKRPDLTELAIDKDGWFNTGDLGMLTYDNEIIITGRAKDTIVLLGGENIEPLVVESAMCISEYVEASVLLGQDKKYLTALVVPNKDTVMSYAEENNITYASYETLLDTPEIVKLIRTELDEQISAEKGFRSCESVFRFKLLPKSFEVGKELSGKQEIMRHKINEIYKDEIEKLFQ